MIELLDPTTEAARLAHPVLRLQDLADPLQELVGVELGVLDEGDALALEQRRPGGVRDRL